MPGPQVPTKLAPAASTNGIQAVDLPRSPSQPRPLRSLGQQPCLLVNHSLHYQHLCLHLHKGSQVYQNHILPSRKMTGPITPSGSGNNNKASPKVSVSKPPGPVQVPDKPQDTTTEEATTLCRSNRVRKPNKRYADTLNIASVVKNNHVVVVKDTT